MIDEIDRPLAGRGGGQVLERQEQATLLGHAQMG
jgi:hypothetical protein